MQHETEFNIGKKLDSHQKISYHLKGVLRNLLFLILES